MQKIRITVLLVIAVALIAALVYLLHFRLVPEPQLPGELAQGTLEWDGDNRSYTYYSPVRQAPRRGLIFVFHGSQGDAAQARLSYAYEFERLAETYGFFVVYPEGYEKHFNGCRKKGPYAANELDIDDVGFIRALTRHFVIEHGADPEAVFATGISNGGQMAIRLALEAPDLVTAVAPVATSMPTPDNMGCTPSGKPVSLLLINGTDDPMNPFDGGKVALYGLVGDRGTVYSSYDSVRYWAELAGHTGEPARFTLPDLETGDASTVDVALWRQRGLKNVALYSVNGGGHNVPHPQLKTPKLLGGTNQDLVGAEAIWAFFQMALVTH